MGIIGSPSNAPYIDYLTAWRRTFQRGKFNAESLTLPVAMDVGRATFGFFNTVEWIAFGALVVAVIFSGQLAFLSAIAALLGIILAAQTVWLLPILDERIAAIIAELTVPHSIDHLIYIDFDVAKQHFSC